MAYPWLKLLHIAAVIIFLGNITTGLFWMRFAVKTKDLKIISHTMFGIIRSDRYFTIPGVVFITAFGLAAAVIGGMPVLRTGWIAWSILLFSLSGIAFAFKVAPLQKKIVGYTSKASEDFSWQKFNSMLVQWEAWGLFALLAPVAAMVMMTLKIPQ